MSGEARTDRACVCLCQTVQALVDAGADVNAPAAEGVTPLMLGASPSPLAYQSCDVWLASDGAPRV